MIIGNGMMAKAFKSQGEIGSDVCIFASGVSNSNCKDKEEFSRENTLLQETLASHVRPAPFVYFGTCSVYDPAARQQPYVLHKLEMEKRVQDHPCGLVVRLPQVAGPNAPPNTLLAAIAYSIRSGKTINVWENATRNIIDVADVVNIASFMVALPNWQLKMVNIANPVSYQIMEIIESVESVLGQKAVLNLVSAGAPYDIDVSAIKPIIDSLDIQFDKDYLTRTIARYYL